MDEQNNFNQTMLPSNLEEYKSTGRMEDYCYVQSNPVGREEKIVIRIPANIVKK